MKNLSASKLHKPLWEDVAAYQISIKYIKEASDILQQGD
jgi:hypothetical protein